MRCAQATRYMTVLRTAISFAPEHQLAGQSLSSTVDSTSRYAIERDPAPRSRVFHLSLIVVFDFGGRPRPPGIGPGLRRGRGRRLLLLLLLPATRGRGAELALACGPELRHPGA